MGIFIVIGVSCLIYNMNRAYSTYKEDKQHKQVVHHHTEDMEPVNYSVQRIVVEFADSVEGRATYNVLFNDTTVLESMYPEEIASGIKTGEWYYNEDLQIH
jgi:hypothetical protein